MENGIFLIWNSYSYHCYSYVSSISFTCCLDISHFFTSFLFIILPLLPYIHFFLSQFFSSFIFLHFISSSSFFLLFVFSSLFFLTHIFIFSPPHFLTPHFYIFSPTATAGGAAGVGFYCTGKAGSQYQGTNSFVRFYVNSNHMVEFTNYVTVSWNLKSINYSQFFVYFGQNYLFLCCSLGDLFCIFYSFVFVFL